ncbi:hypothetical protein [Actinokineospora sp. HUAS TT18]|uniref:hypothetical protein n=1 Tax=Actinokineospora sp. HUAS TT18 TaxID=3447451 RepID=UPI003F523A38
MLTTLTSRKFWLHYGEMVAAMIVGMLVLMPVSMLLFPDPGVEWGAMLMATTMAIGMTAWMAVRGHSWTSIAWMDAAMYVPFLILFPPYWAGWISGDAVMVAGHVLMLPAMAAVMLRH